ncbi:MAG: RidA family protein [Treponema sp.]|jgi:2-iminobutanoate/2-iminopropanoate deaminase|nr:RidA family protein [Treponema sp.]
MKEIVTSPNASAAIGPYSQGVKNGPFLFISGQLPVDPATGDIVKGDAAAQTEQSLRNLKAVVEQGGGGLADVVKATVFLADIADFTAMNEVYQRYFPSECPARFAFQVAALPKAALVEIEAIAAIQ